MTPPRRQPQPSDGGVFRIDPDGTAHRRPIGDDYCFNCGKPGSTCQDCGEVICDACNTNSNAPIGHEPAAHLETPPPHVETEVERLIRENRELEIQIRGTLEDRLRRKNQELKLELATKDKVLDVLAALQAEPPPEGNP